MNIDMRERVNRATSEERERVIDVALVNGSFIIYSSILTIMQFILH